MRCHDCQTNAKADVRYCECCGRAASATSETLGSTATIVAVPSIHDWAPSPLAEDVRCESCGGPTEGDTLCATCYRAYQGILERSSVENEKASRSAPAVRSDEPLEWTLPSLPPADALPAEAPAPKDLKAALPVPPPLMTVTTPEPTRPARGTPPASPGRPVTATPSTKTRNLDSRTAAIAMAGAALIIASVVIAPLGERWLERRQVAAAMAIAAETSTSSSTAVLPVEPSAPAALAANDAASPSLPATPAPTPAEARSALTPAKPKPAAARRPPTAADRNARQTRAVAPPEPVALVAAELPAMTTMVAPASAVAAAPPTVEPVVAAVGPFFEIPDVNERPRVTSQVEPEVPADLRARVTNEVVVLRVLVSQTGRASMVNVLRRSKSGPGVDAAAIAAVKQWTFAPARRRGQVVSCWFNVGVSLSSSD